MYRTGITVVLVGAVAIGVLLGACDGSGEADTSGVRPVFYSRDHEANDPAALEALDEVDALKVHDADEMRAALSEGTVLVLDASVFDELQSQLLAIASDGHPLIALDVSQADLYDATGLPIVGDRAKYEPNDGVEHYYSHATIRDGGWSGGHDDFRPSSLFDVVLKRLIDRAATSPAS